MRLEEVKKKVVIVKKHRTVSDQFYAKIDIATL